MRIESLYCYEISKKYKILVYFILTFSIIFSIKSKNYNNLFIFLFMGYAINYKKSIYISEDYIIQEHKGLGFSYEEKLKFNEIKKIDILVYKETITLKILKGIFEKKIRFKKEKYDALLKVLSKNKVKVNTIKV